MIGANIKCFVIRVTMNNGDIWETRRHTKDGMSEVIQSVLADTEVKGFSVEEQV